MIFSTRVGVQTPRTVAVFAALSMLVALLPVFLAPLPALADHVGPDPLAKTTTEAVNQNLPAFCGLEILVVLDETGSISSAGNESAFVDGFQAFRSAMAGSGSTIGLIEFSSLPQSGGFDETGTDIGAPNSARPVTSGYVSPSNTTLVNYAVNNGDSASITSSYNGNGYTNWQEALWQARDFGVSHGYPDLLIFFTDGEPNTTDGDSHTTDPNDAGSYGDTSASETTEFAIPYANIIKGQSTHMLGFGLGLSGGGAGRLSDVTGPDEAANIGSLDPMTTDYITFNDPDDIAAAFLQVATELCKTTLSVTKWTPTGPDFTFADGAPGGNDPFTKANGWEFSISNLAVDTGTVTLLSNASGTTSGGTVTFEWGNSLRTAKTQVDLAETLKTGWDVLGGNCSINGGNPTPLNSAVALGTISNIPDQANVICNVYNTSGFITLKKSVQNDDGGAAKPEDFNLTANGPSNVSGNGLDGVSGAPVVAGNYTLSEDPKTGYSQVGGWNCGTATMGAENQVTIPIGAHILCTVTNTDAKPKLTLKKFVDNNYGGTAQPNDWDLTATRQGGGDSLAGKSGVSGSVNGGTYDLTEANGPSGYNQVGWDCGDHPSNGSTVTLASGDDVTCTVTNADRPASLQLIKKVADNDFGASAAPSEWNLAADGPGGNDFSGAGGAEDTTLPLGIYLLSETGGPAGWNGSEWDCVGGSYSPINDSVTLGLGQRAVCTITNTATQPKLVKQLILEPGANEVESDFTLKATGPTTIEVAGADSDGAVAQNANVGSYGLTESGPSGYSQVGGWICTGGVQTGSNIALDVGQSATCTVTNSSDPATLTLVKEVNNNNGGLAKAGDFQLTLNGDDAIQGDNNVVPNTEYTVSEDAVAGYSFGGVVCKDGDQTVPHPVTLNEGQDVTCTVTNNDQPGVITVIKSFAHDTDAQPDDFKLTLNDQSVDSGAANMVPGNATYSVDETLLEGWTQISLSCVEGSRGETPVETPVDHPVALSNGQSVVCTIVNGENPTITIEKIAIGEDEANFDFTGDLGSFSFDENGGSKTFEVSPGEYGVTETLAEFWALTGIECSEGGSADLNGASAFFAPDYGDHEECTFTNEQLPKSIEVITEGVCLDDIAPYLKWVVNPVNFDGTEVTITWLDIDPQDPLYSSSGNPLQGMMLWPGTVVDGDLKAIDWAGWVFVDGKWVPGDDGYQDTRPSASIMFSMNPDIVVLQDYPGGEPTCDGPPGKIIVEKNVIGEGGTEFEFTFNTVGFDLADNTLAHGQSSSSGNLEPGTYSVSEDVPAGWLPVVATCDDGSDPSAIEVDHGEVVTCTFNNQIEDVVSPAVLVTVEGACVVDAEQGTGVITVTMPVDDSATVVIKAGNTVIDTLTSDGAVSVPAGQTYTWEATASDGFEFPNGFEDSGTVTSPPAPRSSPSPGSSQTRWLRWQLP